MTNHSDLRIIKTADGSISLYLADLNETYHSVNGALAESVHVFMNAGVQSLIETHPSVDQLNILEIGFGTGLNGLLCLIQSRISAKPFNFHTLEPFPVPESIYSQISYSIDPDNHLQKLHNLPWSQSISYDARFHIKKEQITLEDAQLVPDSYQLIFFDAFSPSRQPEVWKLSNLKKCFDALTPGGFLVTYCSQGLFKRNLMLLGYVVQVLPGAVGKKEMVRAIKP